jgi:hypothetical protein
MSNAIIRTVVRSLLTLTGREKNAREIRARLQDYLKLASQLDATTGSRPVRVPPMRGVDEDMRDWSFFMILEHNTIVNRSITSIVEQLSRNEEPAGEGAIDVKHGVMPGSNPGVEQVEAFRRSVERHLETVAKLGPLRGTRIKQHPIFGPFDAHKWNGMFGFHLKLHLPQAQYVAAHCGDK